MAFPGGYAGLPGQQEAGGPSEQEQKIAKYVQSGMESCLAKSIMAGGAGFALGGVFGLFMASVWTICYCINRASLNANTGLDELRYTSDSSRS